MTIEDFYKTAYSDGGAYKSDQGARPSQPEQYEKAIEIAIATHGKALTPVQRAVVRSGDCFAIKQMLSEEATCA